MLEKDQKNVNLCDVWKRLQTRSNSLMIYIQDECFLNLSLDSFHIEMKVQSKIHL